MSKPLIFISCGQYTTREKALGKSIYSMVEGLGMQPFFAEQVQDLKGLNAFMSLLGEKGSGNCSILNPITFTDEMEVLAALPARLQAWTAIKPIGILPLIKTTLTTRTQDGHAIRQLTYSVVNNTNSRITQINGTVRVPAGILKHWSNSYGLNEERSDDPEYRIFRFDERNIRVILPQSTAQVTNFDFCIQCGINDTLQGDHLGGLLVSERKPALTIWVDGKSYHIEKSMKELSLAAGGN